MKKQILFFIFTLLLFLPTISADIMSINSGGSDQIIITPGNKYIEGFFFADQIVSPPTSSGGGSAGGELFGKSASSTTITEIPQQVLSILGNVSTDVVQLATAIMGLMFIILLLIMFISTRRRKQIIAFILEDEEGVDFKVRFKRKTPIKSSKTKPKILFDKVIGSKYFALITITVLFSFLIIFIVSGEMGNILDELIANKILQAVLVVMFISLGITLSILSAIYSKQLGKNIKDEESNVNPLKLS